MCKRDTDQRGDGAMAERDEAVNTAGFGEQDAALRALLHLNAPPVAIGFHPEPPTELAPFAGGMPAPTPDGRTGRVPAGCVFWMHGAGRAFTTVAADHANCSVGSYTHGFLSLAEAAERE